MVRIQTGVASQQSNRRGITLMWYPFDPVGNE